MRNITTLRAVFVELQQHPVTPLRHRFAGAIAMAVVLYIAPAALAQSAEAPADEPLPWVVWRPEMKRERYSNGLMVSGIVNIGLGALSIVGCIPLPWLSYGCVMPVPQAGYIGSLTTFSALLNAGIVMTAVGAVTVDRPLDHFVPAAVRVGPEGGTLTWEF